jgi:hypothetical protein
MKRIMFSITMASILLLAAFYSCSKDYLNTQPLGSANNASLANEKGVNALLIGAYHGLLGSGMQTNGWFGTWAWAASVDNWVFGSVASDDATKGSDIGDQSSIVPIENYTVNPSISDYIDAKWNANYDGIARANDVLKTLTAATDISPAKATEIKAEAMFIRGWLHFELKRVYNNICYIDETMDPKTVKNTGDTWPNIEADLQFGVDNLPAKQTDVGRPTKYAAMAVLGRVKIFQKKWDEAITLFDAIINSGKYTLMTNFDDNYLIATRNNAESIFEIQYAVNDGTSESANGGYGASLNYPQNVDGTGTCCGFFQPTQNLVNAYKVDAAGLPLFTTFNDVNLANDMGLKSTVAFAQDTVTPVDPRLDWTVGRRGVPFLDWGIMRGNDWIRDQGNAGPYVNKKNMFKQSERGIYSTTTGWATGVNGNNYRAYRLTHILLWRAECAVNKGDLATALGLVNQVRSRAANNAHWVKGRCRTFILPNQTGLAVDNTKYAANYQIGTYASFPDAAYALRAVQWELRLEFAMEGHRHYDLVRWGIADATINAYMTADRNFRSLFGGVKPKSFTPNKNEYWPIPQAQLDVEPGILTQNTGY